jgi:hypothetical protein
MTIAFTTNRTAMEHNADTQLATISDSTETQLSGHQFYVERLSREQIERWDEQTDAMHRALFAADAGSTVQRGYQYRARDHFHAVGVRLRSPYKCRLAHGCAAGDDLASVERFVDRFAAIEANSALWLFVRSAR